MDGGDDMYKLIDIDERAKMLAVYVIETGATVRAVAKKFNVSKSTVHKDIAERLEKVNPSLAYEAKKILEINKLERHIRGGLATQKKYLKKA
jgi:putative DeoR family transcriptional regulator, stage III sporulation protein D